MWPRSRRIPHLVTRRSHPLHQSKTPTQEPGLGRHHRRFVFALSLADPPLISTLFHRSPLHHTFIFLFDFPQRTPSLKTIVQQAPEAGHLHQTHQTLKDPSIAKPEGLASLHIALARIHPTKRAARDTRLTSLHRLVRHLSFAIAPILLLLPSLLPPSPPLHSLSLISSSPSIIRSPPPRKTYASSHTLLASQKTSQSHQATSYLAGPVYLYHTSALHLVCLNRSTRALRQPLKKEHYRQ